jgi:hypothetical protein
VATFRRGVQVDPQASTRVADGEVSDERSRDESVRRARGAVRRYCAANRLDRLGTLTYRGKGCYDEIQLRADVAAFFRALRRHLGGTALPYLWTGEWHPGGHGLHAHFAVGKYVDKALISRAWDRGFVEIRRLNEGFEYASALAKARVAAAYLGKYVAKNFERGTGLHRYEVAQGFQPRRLRFFAETMEVALQFCVELREGAVPRFSLSDEWDGWQGPPIVWMQWAGWALDYQAAVREWVERTCREQGVPAKVGDVVAILRVAAILVEASDAPNRMKATNVNVLGATGGRAHHDVIQHGSDHGAPLVEVEIVPSAPELGTLVNEGAEWLVGIELTEPRARRRQAVDDAVASDKVLRRLDLVIRPERRELL